MRILFVADGRSQTTMSWLRYWIENENYVHLISTYPCARPEGLASFSILPVAFGRFAGRQVKSTDGKWRRTDLIRNRRSFLLFLRYYFGPLSLVFCYSRFRDIVKEIHPDLVHALRIPFEGMLAATTPVGIPFVISCWGNDFTLHARGSFLMAYLTRRTLNRADALISDTQRDIRLGYEWGLQKGKPTLIVPGSGGIRLDDLGTRSGAEILPEELSDFPIVVNPRGQRPGSLRQDIFFQAIPIVLEKIPETVFVCPSLKGDSESERLVESLGIRSRTRLWPSLKQVQLWTLFRKSQIYFSPSIHDGTPNSFLEAIACGCFPVVGNTESMIEWIQPGVNGLLVNARDARSVAKAIIEAINQPVLRKEAAKINAALIAERAAYLPNMERVDGFYRKLWSRE